MASRWVTSLSHDNRMESPRNLGNFHLLPGAEIVTFLPLQMSLYFSVYYYPFWIISLCFALENKYSDLEMQYKFITIIVYLIIFVAEAARLYFGYEGNLREKVPELAGFWILTILQICLTLYLLANVSTIILPLEVAVNIVFLLFLLVQIVLGFRALQLMIRAQAVKFHLSQFDRLEDIPLQTLGTDKKLL